MCQVYNYDWVYTNPIGNLHLLQNIDSNIDKEIADYLLKMFGSETEISNLSPTLLNYIYAQFQAKNVLKKSRNIITARSSSNSIYNFSVAKTNNFLNNIKALKKEKVDVSTLKSYSNLILSTQQSVEVNHVDHISNQVSTILDSGKSELLHYVSENDSKVRHEHKEASGTILPKSDSFWNDAVHLLAQFNCRCTIINALSGSEMNPKGKNYKYAESKKSSISEIDLKSGKAGLFSENLPVFQNASPLIRKYYRKLNDSIYE
jgi:hypothetical protein